MCKRKLICKYAIVVSVSGTQHAILRGQDNAVEKNFRKAQSCLRFFIAKQQFPLRRIAFTGILTHATQMFPHFQIQGHYLCNAKMRFAKNLSGKS